MFLQLENKTCTTYFTGFFRDEHKVSLDLKVFHFLCDNSLLRLTFEEIFR